jgi:hypothetical protein
MCETVPVTFFATFNVNQINLRVTDFTITAQKSYIADRQAQYACVIYTLHIIIVVHGR